MMVIGILRLDLLVPVSQSLKDKRAVIRSLVAQLQNQFHAAVSEVGHQDLWNRALLGVAVVSGAGPVVERLLQQIEDRVAANPAVEIIGVERERVHL